MMISRYFFACLLVPFFSQVTFAACRGCFVYRYLEVDQSGYCLDAPAEDDADLTIILVNPACAGQLTAPGGAGNVCASVNGQIVSDGKRLICKFAQGKEWPPKPFPSYPDYPVKVSKKMEARFKKVDFKRAKAATQ